MKNTGGVLIFKCRRCGREERAWRVPNGFKAALLLSQGSALPAEWGPDIVKPTGIHGCDESHDGITDFIGVEYDP